MIDTCTTPAAHRPSPLQCMVSGRFGHAVIEALARAEGVSFTRVFDLDRCPIPAIGGREGLHAVDTLVVLDIEHPDAVAVLDEARHGSSAFVHMLCLLGDSMFVGPHFRTGTPGCANCFARRRLAAAHREDAGRLDLLARTYLRPRPHLRHGFAPILPHLAARAMAVRMADPLPHVGRFLRFLPDGLFVEDGIFFALHGCCCRHALATSGGSRSVARLAGALGLDGWSPSPTVAPEGGK